MNEKSVAIGGGINITGLLGVVFVTLKLCEVIDWSWWWVLLPFYGPPVFDWTVLGVVYAALNLAERWSK